MKTLPPILLLTFAACSNLGQDPAKAVRPGQWVEAKGKVENGKPMVSEVAVAERSADDKADKIELLGEVSKATPESIEVVGVKFHVDPDTDYETAEKKKVDPFVAKAGDWVRVKARIKGEQQRARTIRQSDARGSFRLLGELIAIDNDQDLIDIGGVRIPLRDDAQLGGVSRRGGDDPLSLFLADDQKGVPFTIEAAPNLRLGGQLSVNPEIQDNYDLSDASQRDRTKGTYGAKFDALWLIGDQGAYAMFEVATGRAETTRQTSSTDTYTRSDSLEVTRALTSVPLADGLQLVAGRQDFYETRRWLYDEVLDGVRLIQTLGKLEFEAGAATGRACMAEDNPTEDTSLLEANAYYDVAKDWRLGAYALRRFDDTVEDHEPFLYGLRSLDRPRTGFGHWVELGGAAGHSTFVPAGNTANRFESGILGYAFDVGGTYSFDAPLRPWIAAGYALGTGAGPDAKKQGYRQSGYNDNNGKMGGVTSIRYYGEVFRPELSNCGIATIAGAIRPTPESSITLLYHDYIQDTPNDFAPVSGLRTSPNGRSADLGYEFDFVFGLRPRDGMTFEFTLGRFVPGPAFDNQDPATKVELTLRVGF